MSPSLTFLRSLMLGVQKTVLMVPVLSFNSTLQTLPSPPFLVLNDLGFEIEITLPEILAPLVPFSRSLIDLSEYSGFSEIASTLASLNSPKTISANVSAPMNEIVAFSFLKYSILAKKSSSEISSLTSLYFSKSSSVIVKGANSSSAADSSKETSSDS